MLGALEVTPRAARLSLDRTIHELECGEQTLTGRCVFAVERF